jgi:hypothetical protein
MTRKRNKMSEMAKYEAKMQREARYQDNLDLLMNGGDELLPGDRMTLARSCWLNTGRDIERSDDRAEIARLTYFRRLFWTIAGAAQKLHEMKRVKNK